MGDMAAILSGRKVAPGSNNHHGPSHKKFEDTITSLYPEAELVSEPKFFKKQGLVAFVPDFSLFMNNKIYFFEVKRQGKGGNAHERVYKIFAPGLVGRVKSLLGLDYHPIVAVFCDGLASEERYRKEFVQNLELGTYLLWDDYRPEDMKLFIDTLFDLT